MSISEEEREQWHAAARRQGDYLTGRLVDAWGDDITDDLRRIMRRIVSGAGVSTEDQAILADEIRKLRGAEPGTFTLKISTDNDAFVGDPLSEVARIVAEVPRRLLSEGGAGKLRDVNGGTVGGYSYVQADD